MIYNVTIFAVFFRFLKMNDCMVIVSEESEISNDLQIFNNCILAIYSSLL